MMDWTDRHCRRFHRAFSRRTWLYSEMVTAAAIVHGAPARLLAFSAAEHPAVLQLGGCDPAELAQAVRLAAPYGYDEINLNVGCPSDRVQSGAFGAVLMLRPGGTVAYIGLPGGKSDEIRASISAITNWELSVRGSNVGTRQDLNEAVAFAANGLVKATIRTAPLEDINAVLDEMRKGKIVGRVVLKLA